MSHHHFCNIAGHAWKCGGTALRPLAGDTEPSVCMCLTHEVPMDHGDHSQCSIELLACPKHREEQLRRMPTISANNCPGNEGETRSSMFTDQDGNPTLGFCLWCNKDFYSMQEVEAHNADDMKACEVFQELKDEDCGPPVLCQMLENSGPLENEDTGEAGSKQP